MCRDNRYIHPDSFPRKLVDDVLDQVIATKYIGKGDASSACWQILVIEEFRSVTPRDDTIQRISQFHEEPTHCGLVCLSFFLHFRWTRTTTPENDPDTTRTQSSSKNTRSSDNRQATVVGPDGVHGSRRTRPWLVYHLIPSSTQTIKTDSVSCHVSAMSVTSRPVSSRSSILLVNDRMLMKLKTSVLLGGAE